MAHGVEEPPWCGSSTHVWGPGRMGEAGPSTGHETTSPHTRLGITSRLAWRLADHPLASRSGEET
jgi:hypothetical protein